VRVGAAPAPQPPGLAFWSDIGSLRSPPSRRETSSLVDVRTGGAGGMVRSAWACHRAWPAICLQCICWRIIPSMSQFSACPCPWFPSRGSDGLLARSFRTMRRYRAPLSRCCRASLSSARSASITSSNRTGLLLPGARRKLGAASIAHASEAHDARIARFSFRVRLGSLTTCDGCSKACAGCKMLSGSRISSTSSKSGSRRCLVPPAFHEPPPFGKRRWLERDGDPSHLEQ
jgi:hypothetical protein